MGVSVETDYSAPHCLRRIVWAWRFEIRPCMFFLEHDEEVPAEQFRELELAAAAFAERLETLNQHFFPSVSFFYQEFSGQTDEHGNATIDVRLPGADSP